MEQPTFRQAHLLPERLVRWPTKTVLTVLMDDAMWSFCGK